MKKYNLKGNSKKSIKLKKEGSVLLLTMFILAGMLLVAISSTYVVTLGIRAGGIQAQSTKSYFIAESGIEKFLFELRKNNYSWSANEIAEVAFSYDAQSGALSLDGNYEVYRMADNILYRSIGEFGNTKRAVEVELN